MLTMIKNKVLVEPLNNDEKNEYLTNSGILVKDSTRPKSRYIRAKVIAVGTGVRTRSGFIPMKDITSVGDIVLYYMPSANTVKVDDKEYTIIRAEDIDAIITEEADN